MYRIISSLPPSVKVVPTHTHASLAFFAREDAEASASDILRPWASRLIRGTQRRRGAGIVKRKMSPNNTTLGKGA